MALALILGQRWSCTLKRNQRTADQSVAVRHPCPQQLHTEKRIINWGSSSLPLQGHAKALVLRTQSEEAAPKVKLMAAPEQRRNWPRPHGAPTPKGVAGGKRTRDCGCTATGRDPLAMREHGGARGLTRSIEDKPRTPGWPWCTSPLQRGRTGRAHCLLPPLRGEKTCKLDTFTPGVESVS